MEKQADSVTSLQHSVELMAVEFKNSRAEVNKFITKYEKDRQADELKWGKVYELEKKQKPPTSYKDIGASIILTIGVISGLGAGVNAVVDLKTAVPLEQGKQTALKLNSIADKQNKLINSVALLSSTVSMVNEKAKSNKEFVDQYIYMDKIPSTIARIQKDIEYLHTDKEN